MRIERIDDKTVKCFLTNEELEEYNIDYKDFVLRSDKAREILREIIEQAEEEVGYKAPNFAFDLQIMMVPDQGMVLTFSEKEPFEGTDGEQILEYLREMKNVLQRTREKLGNSPAQGGGAQKADAPAKKGEESGAAAPARPDFAVFSFEKMKNLLEFAEAIPANLRVKSELYGMNGRFFLCIGKGAASYEKYSRTCVQALEFGNLYAADERGLNLLKEHGECMIEEKALKKLRLA